MSGLLEIYLLLLRKFDYCMHVKLMCQFGYAATVIEEFWSVLELLDACMQKEKRRNGKQCFVRVITIYRVDIA